MTLTSMDLDGRPEVSLCFRADLRVRHPMFRDVGHRPVFMSESVTLRRTVAKNGAFVRWAIRPVFSTAAGRWLLDAFEKKKKNIP